VQFGRAARDELVAVGVELMYREYPLPHALDADFVGEVRDWLAEQLV